MNFSTNRAFFVTGTDTGVGKTLIARALLAKARAHGLSTLGLKPVSAGTELRDRIAVNEDAWHLMQECSVDIVYDEVNPIALPEPMAPHIAAERAGVKIRAGKLVDHCRTMANRAEFTVIEGAGGWDVPLNATESMADIAGGLGFPAVLVVGMRLGCLNHALLTAAAIRGAGLEIAGWVANHIDRDMPVFEENRATLEQRLEAPLLGTVPWTPACDVDIAAEAITIDPMLVEYESGV